jgi:Asp-tRNA(Asn)/Glu-tRNA(Gln) amidotransferase A subunit family amidase
VAAVIEGALLRLADAGVVIVEADVLGLGALIDAITLPVQLHVVVPSLTAWLAASGASIGFNEMYAAATSDVTAIFKRFAVPGAPNAIPDEYYAFARDVHLPTLRALLARWFADSGVDAMLLPATMTTATPIGVDQMVRIGDADVAFAKAMGRNIAPGSTAGLPGLVLAAGLADGLPVGIELDGPAGSDRRLLGIGLAVEALLGVLRPRAGVNFMAGPQNI